MDILFLLKPNFPDPNRDSTYKLYYCPDCAFLEGVLSYYPQLREKIDIRYIDFPRPRKEIVELVGGEQQGCPNLILEKGNQPYADKESWNVYGDRWFTADTRLIVGYLRDRYQIPEAHY